MKLLEGGVFKNIDELRKKEGTDEVTLTPVQTDTDKDVAFRKM